MYILPGEHYEQSTTGHPRTSTRSPTIAESLLCRMLLFIMVAAGSVSHWFWHMGWRFIQDPNHSLNIGSAAVLVAHLILSLCIAALTFPSMYEQMEKSGEEPWMCCLKGFKNGFLWQAAFDAVVGPV